MAGTHEKMDAAILSDDGTRRTVTVTGKRNCDTLRALLNYPSGISSLDRWAYGWRLSHYVFCLRNLGFDIETKEETEGDIRFGRYILRTRVELVSDNLQAAE